MGIRRYCRCGTALAGDNTTRLCSTCQATRQRSRAPDVPPEFWRTEVMTAALASGDLGRVMRAYRCHPFHGQRLSQALVAGWLHMSQAAVCRIENDRRRLTIDEIAVIAQALGMRVALPWAPQPEVGEDVDPLSRRSLFGAGAGAAFGLSATTAPAAAREVDPELVSHWVKPLRVLDLHDARCGPHDVLDTVRHEINLIAAHREIARGELHRQLLRVDAQCLKAGHERRDPIALLHAQLPGAGHGQASAQRRARAEHRQFVDEARHFGGVDRRLEMGAMGHAKHADGFAGQVSLHAIGEDAAEAS